MRHLLLAAALATAVVSPAAAQVVTFATSGEGSLTNAVASAIAKEVSDASDLKMRVAPLGGSSVALPQVNNGSVDLTVGLAVTPAFAFRGEDMFDGRPQSNIRAVASLFVMAPAFMVREDSDIHSITDLKGKRVTSGLQQQKIVATVSEASLQAVGMSWDDIDAVPAPTSNQGIEDLMAGKVDSVMASISSGKSHQADAAVGIRWLPLEDTPEAEEALGTYAPGTHIATIEPSDRYPGVTDPLPALAAPLVIIANENTPDEVVELVVKTLYEKQEELGTAFKAFKDFDPQQMGTDVKVPYHKAAVAFFEKHGIPHSE